MLGQQSSWIFVADQKLLKLTADPEVKTTTLMLKHATFCMIFQDLDILDCKCGGVRN